MKNGILIALSTLVLSMMVLAVPYQCIGQEYYEKGGYRLIQSHYDKALVEGVATDALAQLLLPDFRMTFKLDMWYHGLLYAFTRQADKRHVSIRIGVYPSVTEAEEAILDCLNMIDLRHKEGPVRGERIGDNCWWYEYTCGVPEEKRLHSIAFVRKNVLIMTVVEYDIDLSGMLLDLSMAIDTAIMNGASFITFADTPALPVVTSVQVSKNELRKGETSILTVSAIDPKGKRLEYHCSIGISKSDTDPDNIFRMLVVEGSILETYLGTTQTFEIWVVNEDNLFSRKKQFQITF